MLGRTVVTQGARAALQRSGQHEHEFFDRHQRGDWGDLPEGEASVNDAEVTPEGRNQLRGYVMSAYETRLEDRLWIVTDWASRTTTVSLPFEDQIAPDAPSQT
jgi:hypothetical protein